MKPAILLLLVLACRRPVSAQHIELLTDNNKISFRGLCPVDDKIIWVSGSQGTVGRSVDGGKSWQWLTVKNFEKRDFRDIEAFDSLTAIIMAIDGPANILKTTDGGRNWKIVFTDSTKGMFLDAMNFSGSYGVVIGDPIDHKIFMAFTNDGGNSWKISTILKDINTAEGEAFFAASGTNICLLSKTYAPIFVSGGTQSSIYISSTAKHILPIAQGQNSTGANSLAMAPDRSGKAVIVGGDFAKDTAANNNCVLLTLFPYQTTIPQTPPHGYRSCVEYLSENKLICCGVSGVDISEDGGRNWKLISSTGFHVCRKAKNGKQIFLAGANGNIGRLDW
ncbi:MAG TPA: hypothetical protein VMH01_06195 [Puia sp.]|nr:hypothetical protein [Puia sp.]